MKNYTFGRSEITNFGEIIELSFGFKTLQQRIGFTIWYNYFPELMHLVIIMFQNMDIAISNENVFEEIDWHAREKNIGLIYLTVFIGEFYLHRIISANAPPFLCKVAGGPTSPTFFPYIAVIIRKDIYYDCACFL